MYAIAELKEGEVGGFTPRGGAAALWKARDHELVIAGPAETGKTYGALQKLDALLWKYPGSQAVMIRKTLVSLYTSCWQTYKNILGPEPAVSFYGGEKPEWVQYPNGSRLYLAGMDNPQKALSSERDFIYINQLEELSLDDYEVLTTRCTGRAANAPYAQIFGDCNPGPPSHWIKHRPSLRLIESRHEDNPTLYDDAGNLTERGKISMAILDALTGVRKQRLRYGRWVQAEGVVYEGWDAAVHLIDRFSVPDDWPRFWCIDFGYTNPFVWGEWAQDGDGRLYLLREIYMTKRLVEDHAAQILALTEDSPKPVEVIGDHDAEDRATFERKTRYRVMPAWKGVSDGIQAVAERLRVQGDGKPRLFVLRDSLVERDEELAAQRKPVCTAQEFDVYAWPQGMDGKPVKEQPVKDNDHGMDMSRYLVARFDCVETRRARIA